MEHYSRFSYREKSPMVFLYDDNIRRFSDILSICRWGMKNFFRVITLLQEKTLQYAYDGELKSIILKIIIPLSIIVSIFTMAFGMNFALSCILLIATMFLLCFFPNILLSFKKFLLTSIFVGTTLTIIIFILLSEKLTNKLSGDKKFLACYILFIVIMVIVWTLLSFFANNKVARLTNLVGVTITGIITIIKDAIFTILPENLYLEKNITNVILSVYSITPKQLLDLGITFIVSPMLVTNIIVTLMCEVKAYWIIKYNNGIDVTDKYYTTQLSSSLESDDFDFER